MSSFSTQTTALLCLCLAMADPVFSQPADPYPPALSRLHEQVEGFLLHAFEDPPQFAETLSQLDEQGAWPGIDYSSRTRSGWPQLNHLHFTLPMAKAYRSPHSAYYQDEQLAAQILRALDYWLAHDFESDNWWYNQIGVPQQLGPLLILMEDKLTAEQMAKGIRLLDKSEIRMTGQNKVWLSGNVLLKALLLRDSLTVDRAAAAIREELIVSEGEGVQSDGSFHQHGPQLQFGNYGLSYIGSMIQWITILRGTPFQFDEAKLEILRNYLLDGQQWVNWYARYEISSCGRQLSPGSPETKSRALAGYFQQMARVDTAFAGAYQRALNPARLSGNKHFWRTDFQVHRRPGYLFSLKMCSERVVGAESCNSENVLGYYMGDGATFLYQTGREYDDIFPFWDWKKIPGTTTHQNPAPLRVLTCSGYRLESSFVGGVSDGRLGIATLDYRRDGLSARKSWFFFDDLLVCLGAGIESGEGHPVTTSLDQTLFAGQVLAHAGGEQALGSGNWTWENPKWVLHGQTGYYFPAGGQVRLETQPVSGSWHRVAMRYPDEPIEAPVFKLWMEHGENPTAQGYAYAVVPHASAASLRKLARKQPFRLLANEKHMQAVVSTSGSLAGVVFYEAGKAEVFGGVAVDQPCLLLLKKAKSAMQVSVSDPTQKLARIQLRVKGQVAATGGSGAGSVIFDGQESLVTIVLPAGKEAGKTVSLNLTHL